MDDRKNLPDHETLTPLIHYSPKPDSGNLQKKSCFIEVCVGALAFPLRVGDKYQYERQPWPNGNGYYSGKCKAAAAENVTVPAGTYETIRVECKGTWTRVSGGALSGNITQTLWYSTKVNRLVKWIFIDYKPSGKREADTKRQTEMIEFIQK